MNSKKIKIIIIIIVAVLITTTGTIVVLANLNKKPQETTQEQNKVTQEKADMLKEKAFDALKNNDTELAKTLFEQAKEGYEELGDTNNVVDTESQIYFIEHPSTPSNTELPDPKAGNTDPPAL